MSDIPELQTERLVLRQWRDEDLDPFAAMNADPEVMRFLGKQMTRAESDHRVAQIREHFRVLGFGKWAVEVRDAARFIGFVGIERTNFEAPFTPSVEIGWRLAREAWGKGFATEAARAAISFGFDKLGLNEIVSFTVPDNVPSQRVMERLGMTRDPAEDFDHPFLAEGHPLRKHVLYRLRSEALFNPNTVRIAESHSLVITCDWSITKYQGGCDDERAWKLDVVARCQRADSGSVGGFGKDHFSGRPFRSMGRPAAVAGVLGRTGVSGEIRLRHRTTQGR